MSWSEADKRLGMDRPITRRHFLDGIAATAGAAMALHMGLPGAALAQEGAGSAGAYPPAGTGLRGQTDDAQSVMHAIRDGSYWQKWPETAATGEHYDLIVVGAGISGLAAAFTYRQQAGADKKVLIIDPLEDFGGHAKRNEFTTADGKRLIGYGGSQSLDTPSFFSPAVRTATSLRAKKRGRRPEGSSDRPNQRRHEHQAARTRPDPSAGSPGLATLLIRAYWQKPWKSRSAASLMRSARGHDMGLLRICASF